MPPLKRKRRLSATFPTSRPSSSQPSTPLASIKRQSFDSQPQPQCKRVMFNSQPLPERVPSISQVAPSEGDKQSFVADEDNADEALDNVVMAVDMKERGTIGCAYYMAREERLFCMEDIMNGGSNIVETLKLELQPTVVLVSLRIDSEEHQLVAPEYAWRASLIDEADGRLPLPYRLDCRPNSEFSYEGAKNKLVNLQPILADGEDVRFLIPGEPLTYDDMQEHDEFRSTSRQGKLLRISGWINLDSKVSMGCVGAVLTYLQRKQSAELLRDERNAQHTFGITSMEMFSMEVTMFINADTLLSLQIIQPESRPNAFSQGLGSTGSKESLSIYGLFHYLAHTPQGRARLRQLFLRPSLNSEEIESRLDFVSVFVRQENMIPFEKLSKSMSKIKNMRTTTILLRKGTSGGNRKYGGFKSGVWASLLEFAYHTIDVRDTLREIQRIGKAIYNVVDLDSSIEKHRTVIKRGVNDRLDKIKDLYDGMDKLLSRAAIEVTRTLPADFEININVIYLPQLGYHITVSLNTETNQPIYDGGDRPWEMMFTTQDQVYYKDDRMREMDEQIGDLWAVMCDTEIEISYDLAQQVLEDERLLVAVSDFCGELDSLLALAHGASQHKLTRPRMTDENLISIKAGWHLLQEMIVPTYITNDAFIVGGGGDQQRERSQTLEGDDPTLIISSKTEGPSMILLTGPNYSGKSVYQKQIAVAVYMAHVGSFVAAESAEIGLTDKILTRITTRETVSKTESAFMIGVQQIALALKQATRRSLIVIDEFGKGTDSCDGAGLAAGVFEYLLSLGSSSPKVLAATHFHEIFEYGFLRPRPNLAFAHMEVLVDKKGKGREGDIATEVTYLYVLRSGRSTLSYGTQCAAMNGIPASIVARAANLAMLACQGEDLVAICAPMSVEEEEDLEDAEMTARAFLEQDFEEVAYDEDPRVALESVLGGSITGSANVS